MDVKSTAGSLGLGRATLSLLTSTHSLTNICLPHTPTPAQAHTCPLTWYTHVHTKAHTLTGTHMHTHALIHSCVHTQAPHMHTLRPHGRAHSHAHTHMRTHTPKQVQAVEGTHPPPGQGPCTLSSPWAALTPELSLGPTLSTNTGCLAGGKVPTKPPDQGPRWWRPLGSSMLAGDGHRLPRGVGLSKAWPLGSQSILSIWKDASFSLGNNPRRPGLGHAGGPSSQPHGFLIVGTEAQPWCHSKGASDSGGWTPGLMDT